MDAALEPLGIGVTQVAALLHLKRQPGLSGAELARRMLITPQSTATLLSNLERRGWIRRAPHAVHRALVEASLTEAGEAILRAGEARIAETDRAVSRGLDDTARDALLAALDICLANARTLTERARGGGG
jgi:DNA-binding MarR family transcriptional regulator